MALTIITRLRLLALGENLNLQIVLLLTLSVLLVGNCLTVARVGIIIISLDHGSTYLKSTPSMVIKVDPTRLDLTPFPIFSLAYITTQMAYYGILAHMECIGLKQFLTGRRHLDFIFKHIITG